MKDAFNAMKNPSSDQKNRRWIHEVHRMKKHHRHALPAYDL
jgi:hypothetical protein